MMDLEKRNKKSVGSEGQRAVSPVIGVILMVAITVILAAVIATFVMDIGDLDEGAPNAQYDWEGDDQEIIVSHSSGDNIDLNAVTVTVTLESGAPVSGDETQSKSDLSGEFTAGDEIRIHNDTANDIYVDGDLFIEDDGSDALTVDDIEEVTVTWEADGTSTILTDYEP